MLWATYPINIPYQHIPKQLYGPSLLSTKGKKLEKKKKLISEENTRI